MNSYCFLSGTTNGNRPVHTNIEAQQSFESVKILRRAPKDRGLWILS